MPLDDALDAVLGEDVVSPLDIPAWTNSAMDGYATRGDDVRGATQERPVRLTVVEHLPAGRFPTRTIAPGECARIFTGAPVPEGANLIVIQENADEGPGSVTVREVSGEPHIRPRGQDFAEGEVLLTAGTRLGPRELMLAAAMNQVDLPVRRKPKVAILATGNEVVPPGSDLAADQIVSSVPSGLAALVARHGGEAMPLGIAQDDPESILALARAGSGADILLTIGGASVGEYDLVGSALKSEGLELDFWKIAMRPGKPLLFGRLGKQRVLGVPWNPVSALVCAEIFLVPMLVKLLGATEERRPLPEAVLGVALPANGPREHYMRARSEWREDGARVVTPLLSQDSSLVAALARADCLIVRAPDAAALPQGAAIRIVPLHRG